MKRLIRHMGPSPPSHARVKVELLSPPGHHVKREQVSPLRWVKDEPASPPPQRYRGVRIGLRVKDKPSSHPLNHGVLSRTSRRCPAQPICLQ